MITVIKSDNRCYQKREQSVINFETHKRQYKDNITKEIKSSIFFDDNSVEFVLAKLLFNLILKRNPNHKKPDLQKWAYEIDKMIRLDKRDPKNIEEVIQWCQASDFWQNNILSTLKLRKQYDQLWLKMNESKKNSEDSEFIKNWLKEK